MENFNFEAVLDTLKNVQIYPAKKRVELNDKATEIIFSMTREMYQKLIELNASVNLHEKKGKKRGDVWSSFQIQNEDGYSNFIPLFAFDRAVLSVCVSNWLEGNRFITPAIIYRGLTGKVNDKIDRHVNKQQLAAILQSVDKLMFTTYDPKLVEAYKKLNYIKDDEEIEITKSAVMPCYRVKAKINGQEVHAIFFDRESPLLISARLKKQLLTYDAELLDVPNQNNTPMIIAIKNYVMHRVQEIKLHKQMRPTLKFEDIFKKCRIAGTKNKQRTREYVEAFFEHLKTKNQIKSFKITKKHNTFYSVEFTH